MYLRDLYASIRRRWYFIVAGILLTAALVVLAYREVPVKYEATGSVALIPPPTAVISGDNPFLYMGGLEQALGVLTVKLNSPAVERPITQKYPGVEYTTARDSSTNGPIVLVSVTGSTPEETLGALRQVMDAVPKNLAALQEALDLNPGARMSSMPLALDDETAVRDSSRTRIALALAALGGAATLLLTGQLDKILLRRKDRRGARSRRQKRRESREADVTDAKASPTTKDGRTPLSPPDDEALAANSLSILPPGPRVQEPGSGGEAVGRKREPVDVQRR